MSIQRIENQISFNKILQTIQESTQKALKQVNSYIKIIL